MAPRRPNRKHYHVDGADDLGIPRRLLGRQRVNQARSLLLRTLRALALHGWVVTDLSRRAGLDCYRLARGGETREVYLRACREPDYAPPTAAPVKGEGDVRQTQARQEERAVETARLRAQAIDREEQHAQTDLASLAGGFAVYVHAGGYASLFGRYPSREDAREAVEREVANYAKAGWKATWDPDGVTLVGTRGTRVAFSIQPFAPVDRTGANT